tara:strand:- start:11161 stop:11364 length:204 start_codon:yes stop_codon:yes gene_type:complete
MSNETNENDIIAKRRVGYLSHYTQGIEDALYDESSNPKNTFSDYYKKGYKKGLDIKEKMLIKGIPYG